MPIAPQKPSKFHLQRLSAPLSTIKTQLRTFDNSTNPSILSANFHRSEWSPGRSVGHSPDGCRGAFFRERIADMNHSSWECSAKKIVASESKDSQAELRGIYRKNVTFPGMGGLISRTFVEVQNMYTRNAN